MICGRRAQLHCQRGAAKIVKLIRVDLERESQRSRNSQDLARLLQVKGFVLTEDIYKWQRQARRVSIPPLAEHRQHRFANEIGIALRVVFKFRSDGMRAKKCES